MADAVYLPPVDSHSLNLGICSLVAVTAAGLALAAKSGLGRGFWITVAAVALTVGPGLPLLITTDDNSEPNLGALAGLLVLEALALVYIGCTALDRARKKARSPSEHR